MAEILISIIWLRVAFMPRRDFVFIDEDFTVFNPRGEFVQGFAIVIFTNARIDTEVPIMNAANQVVPIHMTVFEQSASMQAAAIEDRDFFFITDNNEINIGDQSPCGLTVYKVLPTGNANRFHKLFFLSLKFGLDQK